VTNLQAGPARGFRREWFLLGAPVVAGLLVSLGVGAVLVWPAWQRLQSDQRELEQLAEQRQRLPLLRAQLLKLSETVEQAEQRRSQILGLIAGSGEISTFMAQLSAEAQRTGVVLDGYEPITTAAPAAPAAKTKPAAGKDKDKTPAPPADPLLAPGLQKTSLLLTARGTGPQLLAFLRALEKLSLLVVQSDLSLKHEATDTAAKPGAAAASSTELRVNLSLYGKAPPSRPEPPSTQE
jgi:type IV pilus assembly protein PilO